MTAANYVCPMSMKQRFRAALTLYRINFGKFLFLYSGLACLAILLSGANFYLNYVMKRSLSIVFLFDLLLSPATLIASTAAVVATSNAVLQRPVKAAAALQRALSPRVMLCVFFASLPLWVWSLIYYAITDQYARPAGIQLDPGYAMMLSPWYIQLLSILNSFLPFGYFLFVLFVPAVTILERGSVTKTIQRALTLSLGNFGRVFTNYGLAVLLPAMAMAFLFGCALGCFILFLVLSNAGAVQADPQAFTSGMTAQILILLAFFLAFTLMVLTPLTNLVVLLLYYDIRARKENYDEVALAEEMGYRPLAEMITT